MTGPRRSSPEWQRIRTQLVIRRAVLNMTQAQAARKAGTGRTMLQKIEAGTRVPGADILIRLAGVYGLEVRLGPPVRSATMAPAGTAAPHENRRQH